ncbi:hypothetical protein [Pseudaestuariivita sp.]|uniref:hypothetical protein n=1 Tax=Pseudaestuariivita sp. TaxID=2211669 RepID=UPI004057EDA7
MDDDMIKNLRAQARVAAELRDAISRNRPDTELVRIYQIFAQFLRHEEKRIRREARRSRRARRRGLFTRPAMPRLGGVRAALTGPLRLVDGTARGILRLSRNPVRVAALSLMVGSTALAAGAYVAPGTTGRIFAAIVTSAPLADEGPRTRLDSLDCATFVPVLDRNDALLGYGPKKAGCGAPGDRTANRFTPSLVTAALPPDQVDRYARIIAVVEGASTGGGTLGGINLTGLARAAKGAATGDRIGGSSGFVSAYEVAGDEQALSRGVGDKLATLRDAALLATGTLSDAQIRDFVTRGLPAAIEFSGPRAGLALAGGILPQAVFGVDGFEDLGDGHLCLLAAAAKKHIILPGPDATQAHQIQAEDRLEWVKQRARNRCVQAGLHDGVLTPAQATVALAEIDAYKLPVGTQALISPPGLGIVLADAAGLSAATGPIRTQMSRDGQDLLVAEIGALRRDIAPRLATGLCATNCIEGEERLDVLAAIARIDANAMPITAFSASRHGLWHGPLVAAAGAAPGDAVRGTPKRAIASLAKALALPALIHSGVDLICRRDWANIRDRGQRGMACDAPGAMVTLPVIVGRSLNTAFAEAIRVAGTDTVVAGLEALGGHVPSYGTEAQLRRALATGTALGMSPEGAMRAFATLVAAAEDSGSVPGPSLHAASVDLPSLPAPETGFSGNERVRLAEALGAAIHRSGGTLYRLREPLIEMGCDAHSLFGKTGTSEATTPTGVRDRMAIVHATCGGVSQVAMVVIGSPDIDRPADGTHARDVERLILTSFRAGLNASSDAN